MLVTLFREIRRRLRLGSRVGKGFLKISSPLLVLRRLEEIMSNGGVRDHGRVSLRLMLVAAAARCASTRGVAGSSSRHKNCVGLGTVPTTKQTGAAVVAPSVGMRIGDLARQHGSLADVSELRRCTWSSFRIHTDAARHKHSYLCPGTWTVSAWTRWGKKARQAVMCESLMGVKL
jgi:hypothetical protein